MKYFLSLTFLALTGAGCITRTVSQSDFGHGEARQADAAGAYRVMLDGKVQGYVIRFEEHSGVQGSLISVRNAFNQDMGWIDSEGRAWRYRLHEDPEWIGTGNVLQGTRSILGLAMGASLEAVDLADLALEH